MQRVLLLVPDAIWPAVEKPLLPKDWMDVLGKEFECDYMLQLRDFLKRRQAQQANIYPAPENIFQAFLLTPLQQVKAVILGQDPYHGAGQAHGLSFSVPKGVTPPPSLKNIFRELRADLHITTPAHGCLRVWAERGVFLLNSVLTVEEGQAGAHRGRGWEIFTDRVISLLNTQRNGIAFMLWGAYAQSKKKLLSSREHLILEAAHPSPLSAYRGFLGCGHFSRTNRYLSQHGLTPIDWHLE